MGFLKVVHSISQQRILKGRASRRGQSKNKVISRWYQRCEQVPRGEEDSAHHRKTRGSLLGSLWDSPSPPNNELLLLICVSVLKALLTLHIFVFSSVQNLISPLLKLMEN